MAKPLTGNRVMLTNVRLAFPHLFAPSQVDSKSGWRRGALFIIEKKDTALLETINKAIADAATAKWPDPNKRETIMALLWRKDYVCLHDGDTKAQYDGFEGNWYVSANASSSDTPEGAGKVTILDEYKRPLTADSGRPYAGCYVNALVEVYAQDNAFGRRINAALKGVQFLRDGDAFGGGPPASADDFETVAEGVDAEDFA